MSRGHPARWRPRADDDLTLGFGQTAPTINNMGQEFSLFKDTLCDVTDTTFSQHAFPGTQADVTIDGRVYGMPITIEALGLLYNQAVLDAAVGGTFDPATITTRTALAELLAAVDALDIIPSCDLRIRSGLVPWRTLHQCHVH